MAERPVYEQSASSAGRSLACTGWAALAYFNKEQLQPLNKDSSYSLLGTAAHSVLEKRILNLKSVPADMDMLVKDGNSLKAVDFATHRIKKLIKRKGGAFKAEARIEIFQDLEYRGTVDFTLLTDKELIVVDYKHGIGVPVHVVNNWQLLSYAWGRYNSLGKKERKRLKKITCIVIQPRCTQVEPWQEHSYTVKEFLKLTAQLRTGIETADTALNVTKAKGTPPKKKTLKRDDDNCQFCICKPVCPRWHIPASKAIKQFRADTTAKKEGYPTPTGEELEQLYIDAIGMTGYFKKVSELIAANMEKRGTKSLLKKVAGTSRRYARTDAVERLAKLHKKGKITQAQYNACVKVSAEGVGKLSATLESKHVSGLLEARTSAPRLVPKTSTDKTIEDTHREQFKNG